MMRALIVDDEPLPRERVRTLLAAHRDIEVVGECRDGREAVDMILVERPALVFLDIQMPELDGFEVIRAISDEYLPAIVFITAFDEYAIRAFEVNAIDYLLKPINAERFEQAARRAVGRLSQANPSVPTPGFLSCAPPTWTGLTRRIITCAYTFRGASIWCVRR